MPEVRETTIWDPDPQTYEWLSRLCLLRPPVAEASKEERARFHEAVEELAWDLRLLPAAAILRQDGLTSPLARELVVIALIELLGVASSETLHLEEILEHKYRAGTPTFVEATVTLALVR